MWRTLPRFRFPTADNPSSNDNNADEAPAEEVPVVTPLITTTTVVDNHEVEQSVVTEEHNTQDHCTREKVPPGAALVSDDTTEEEEVEKLVASHVEAPAEGVPVVTPLIPTTTVDNHEVEQSVVTEEDNTTLEKVPPAAALVSDDTAEEEEVEKLVASHVHDAQEQDVADARAHPRPENGQHHVHTAEKQAERVPKLSHRVKPSFTPRILQMAQQVLTDIYAQTPSNERSGPKVRESVSLPELNLSRRQLQASSSRLRMPNFVNAQADAEFISPNASVLTNDAENAGVQDAGQVNNNVDDDALQMQKSGIHRAKSLGVLRSAQSSHPPGMKRCGPKVRDAVSLPELNSPPQKPPASTFVHDMPNTTDAQAESEMTHPNAAVPTSDAKNVGVPDAAEMNDNMEHDALQMQGSSVHVGTSLGVLPIARLCQPPENVRDEQNVRNTNLQPKLNLPPPPTTSVFENIMPDATDAHAEAERRNQVTLTPSSEAENVNVPDDADMKINAEKNAHHMQDSEDQAAESLDEVCTCDEQEEASLARELDNVLASFEPQIAQVQVGRDNRRLPPHNAQRHAANVQANAKMRIQALLASDSPRRNVINPPAAQVAIPQVGDPREVEVQVDAIVRDEGHGVRPEQLDGDAHLVVKPAPAERDGDELLPSKNAGEVSVRKLPTQVRDVPKPQHAFEVQPDNFSEPFKPPHFAAHLRAHQKNLAHPMKAKMNAVIRDVEYSAEDMREVMLNRASLDFWVDTVEELYEMTDALKQSTLVAISIIQHTERSFMGFICVIAISTRHHHWLVDAQVLRPHIHKTLTPIFLDDLIGKVAVSGNLLIPALERDFGIYIVNFIDLSQAAEILFEERLTIPDLHETYCGAEVAQQQMSSPLEAYDWRQRPLPIEMQNHAQNTSRHLLDIYDSMLLDLCRRDKLVEAYTRSARVARIRHTRPKFQPSAAITSAMRRNFSDRQLNVLYALLRWRFYKARQEDESIDYVLSFPNALAIARHTPADMQALCAALNVADRSDLPPYLVQHAHLLLDVVLKSRSGTLKWRNKISNLRRSNSARLTKQLNEYNLRRSDSGTGICMDLTSTNLHIRHTLQFHPGPHRPR